MRLLLRASILTWYGQLAYGAEVITLASDTVQLSAALYRNSPD